MKKIFDFTFFMSLFSLRKYRKYRGGGLFLTTNPK